MAYREWLTISLEVELDSLNRELSRALSRLETLRREYDSKWVSLRYTVRRIREIEARIKNAEAEVRRARKKSRRALREARDRLADIRAEITPYLARREEIISDINYERDVLLRPLLSRIETLRRNIREIERELEARKRTVTVQSEPISVAFRYDEVETTTPVTFTVYRDETVTVYMPDRAELEGIEYTFRNWENGSTNPTRAVTVEEDTTVTAYYEEVVVPPVGYILREYTAYLEYPEYKATAHSPAVRFEARGVFTVPRGVDPESDVVKDVIQTKLIDAIIEIGKERTRVDPITREIIKERFEPSVLNPVNFDQGIVVGTEDLGETTEFTESVTVDIVKYREMREIQRWRTTIRIREDEISE